MKCDKINLSETKYFSKLFLDYVNGEKELESFYHLTPNIQSFKNILDSRRFDNEKRNLLNRVLARQYQSIDVSKEVNNNLEKLKNPKTFTITTGHQLNILTGPLFFIFKIIAVINTCKKLNDTYQDYNFVPVYWMASEDHDIEEIRSVTLFGKTYTWDTNQKGAVGKMNPQTLTWLLDQLPERTPLFEKAYSQFNILSDSVRYYVNELFGSYGLLVLDADDKSLKQSLKEIILDDLTNHHANDLVEGTSSKLGRLGYNAQVYPRAINLFYMKDKIRGRLVREQGTYQVLDENLTFSKEEMLNIADNSPELFSPNVILRPLYQELILPNLAYIGGPAEVAYWLQLRDVFDYYKISFPIIMPRNFALLIGRNDYRKLNKLMIRGQDLFLDIQELKRRFLEEHAAYSLTIDSEKKIMDEVFESIKNKTRAVDQSLEGFIESEKSKMLKNIENIEKRLTKAEENKQATSIQQIERLKENLFPGGSLQERVENFLTFYLNNPDFISTLIDLFDPFDYRFNICYEE